ncbi:MAG TPA: TonB family protein [Candidatus Acidoferrum sp.]|nr:TonB family protein [Candidatus Acidoferrum sp.]
MNRLQKKCVAVTVGIHLLLLTILIVGPAFFAPKPKADDLPVLDVIPANLVDAAFNSGVANAAPPPPEPVAPPQPPLPVPVVTPPPAPDKVEPVKPPDKLTPADLKPLDKTTKPEPRKPEISLKPVTRTAPKPSPNANADANNAARARAIRAALKNLNRNLTSATTVDMPGNSSVAYANYASAVKSIYEQAWILPADVSDNANTKVSVTIANDGTVISARIITPSGDAGLDASVQRTLERVKFIAPFPDGATDKERTYTINFNPQVKRLLE